MTQLQVNAGTTQLDELNEIKRQLAHTELELSTLQQQRKGLENVKRAALNSSRVELPRENQERTLFVNTGPERAEIRQWFFHW